MNNSSFYNSFHPSTFPVQDSHPKPKIVTVPVHFLRSDSTRSKSALKIQKVFRGFMARRIVKQLIALNREVNEIESKILNSVEILRIDDKERLILNEKLMSLLFKLDSVIGTLPGIRDCRKAVIKKAIALQERIDAIVIVSPTTLEIKADVCNCNCEVEQEMKKSEESCVECGPDSGEEQEMKKLVENNEVQMKMIRMLRKRVEELERDLLCEKLKNKQRKMNRCVMISQPRMIY